ncbi:MAG: FliO/MopB family protein [Succinivibrio sp.]
MIKLAAAICALLPALAFAEGQPSGAAQGGLGTGQIVSWLFSTCAIVAFIVVLAYIVKKTRMRLGGGGQSRVISQIPVGPKERIAEVRIAGRRLIVGVTPQNVSLLCDLGEDGADGFARKLSEERQGRASQEGDGAPSSDGGDGSDRH